MQKRYVDGDKKQCLVCRKRTEGAYEYGYTDGISIRVPCCKDCKDEMGWCLNPAMDAHLKSIASSVRMSITITSDEKYIRNLREREGAK